MSRDDEILRRLDQHMARGNKLMEGVREEHRLNREAYERGTRLMIDIVARHERAFKDYMELNREIREELRLGRGRIEAQTQAIWAMLDRLGGSGGPAPA